MRNYKFFLILLFACVTLTEVTAQVKHKKKTVAKTVPPKDADKPVYTVRFPKNKSTALLTSYLMGLAHPVTFIVNVTHGKFIKAEIKEMVEPANIRITHIYTPDGMSDGPFSHTLTYPIKHKGIYKIIVGGSNMQGDDWKGVFTMRVTIQ